MDMDMDNMDKSLHLSLKKAEDTLDMDTDTESKESCNSESDRSSPCPPSPASASSSINWLSDSEEDNLEEQESLPPFLGFDPDAMKPILDSFEAHSSDLMEEIKDIEETVAVVAGIASVNQGGLVQIPNKLLAYPPEEKGEYFSLKIIRMAGQKKSVQELVADLLEPFEWGWRRELMYTKSSWTTAELVQYVAPDGSELRSMEAVEECLISTNFGSGLTLDNFSFHKSPVAGVKKSGSELVYIVDVKTGGKYCVNAPAAPRLEIPYKRPTLGKFGHAAAAKRIGNDTFFKLKPKPSPANMYLERAAGGPDEYGEFEGLVKEMHTCSVRCAAMLGYAPSIQCCKCLCLFHHVCVGIPQEVDSESMDDFVCQNCVWTAPGTNSFEMLNRESSPSGPIFVPKINISQGLVFTPTMAPATPPNSTTRLGPFGRRPANQLRMSMTPRTRIGGFTRSPHPSPAPARRCSPAALKPLFNPSRIRWESPPSRGYMPYLPGVSLTPIRKRPPSAEAPAPGPGQRRASGPPPQMSVTLTPSSSTFRRPSGATAPPIIPFLKKPGASAPSPALWSRGSGNGSQDAQAARGSRAEDLDTEGGGGDAAELDPLLRNLLLN